MANVTCVPTPRVFPDLSEVDSLAFECVHESRSVLHGAFITYVLFVEIYNSFPREKPKLTILCVNKKEMTGSGKHPEV